MCIKKAETAINIGNQQLVFATSNICEHHVPTGGPDESNKPPSLPSGSSSVWRLRFWEKHDQNLKSTGQTYPLMLLGCTQGTIETHLNNWVPCTVLVGQRSHWSTRAVHLPNTKAAPFTNWKRKENQERNRTSLGSGQVLSYPSFLDIIYIYIYVSFLGESLSVQKSCAKITFSGRLSWRQKLCFVKEKFWSCRDLWPPSKPRA